MELKYLLNCINSSHHNVEEYYNDLKLVLELVEDLNLNTRIWTKE